MGKLLKVREVAQQLDLARSTVYVMCQRGDLPTLRIGGTVRVPSDLLDAWLSTNTQQPIARRQRGHHGATGA